MRLYVALVACCVGLAGFGAAMTAHGEQPARGWMSDFNKAEAEARRLGVPLVIHFYADWCGPCRQMEADVLNRPEVVGELGSRVIGVKVNSDFRADVVTRYGITALPSDVIVSPQGTVLSKTTGFQDRGGYVARMAGFGAQYAKARAANIAAAVAAAEKKDEAAVAETDPSKDEPVGLQGFSPVSLTKDKQWIAGRAEYSWVHQGIEYRMSTAEEFEEFKSNPTRYAPQFLGCDPMILATTQRTVSGNIKYGAFWRGALYLFYSEENRSHFLQEPQRYAEVSTSIEVDRIELLSSLD